MGINALALVVMAGLLALTIPPLQSEQPSDGFVLEGGVLAWALPAIFLLLAGGGTLALGLSILWLGGIVSREKPGFATSRLEAQAGAAAEKWGRKNPRGMVLVFAAFVVALTPFLMLAQGRRVVGTAKHLTLDGYFQLAAETVPWGDVEQIVLLRETAGDGDRLVTLRFELADGRVDELKSNQAWPLSDGFLAHFEAFCAAHSLPLREG